MQELVNAAKEVYGADPMFKTRKRMNVWARMAVAVVLFRRMGCSDIGRELEINHATAIHYLKQHEGLYQFDKMYQNLFNKFVSIVDVRIVNKSKRLAVSKLLNFLDDKQLAVIEKNILDLRAA